MEKNSDLKISEMLKFSKDLWSLHKDTWSPMEPEYAKDFILYMIEEKLLEKAFVDVFNRLKANSDDFIETLSKNIEKVLAKRAENNDLTQIENKIQSAKDELKGLIKLQTKGQMDEEVYNEEYVRLSGELEKLRQEKAKIEKGNVNVEQYKERVAEIVKAMKEQEGLLIEFDENIFNALVERIEVLEATHFVFVLRNGMKVEENRLKSDLSNKIVEI